MLLLANAAVSTAGDAERYVIIDGHRYSHIINPSTGVGIEDRASVTVVAPDGAHRRRTRDNVYVMGPERGLKLVDDTPGARRSLSDRRRRESRPSSRTRFKHVPLAPPE